MRGLRLEQLFREELNSLLDGEVIDDVLENARVVRVELSRDGSRARVFFTDPAPMAAAADPVQRHFERAAGFLRRRLCEAISLKRTPELRFVRASGFEVSRAADD